MKKTKPNFIRAMIQRLRMPVVDAPTPMRFEAPKLPAGVVPEGVTPQIATDSSTVSLGNCLASTSDFGIYPHFRGYGLLAQYAQISEFRAPTTTLATEMTREWIELKSTGNEDHSDVLKAIAEEMDRLNVRDVIKQALETDGFFGRGTIYIDVGQRDIDETPLVIDPRTIKKGSLQGFKSIEPIWTTPAQYNAVDPTAPDFYRPTGWYVMGRQVHASRLLLIVSHPLPDMLKPAYNFSGMSMSQLIEPYVFSWLRTRKSVSDIVKSFSISGIKTNMQSMLQSDVGAEGNLLDRVELYNTMRDNRGLFMLDKDSEEFFQFNTPLSTLDALQAQSQEQMAAPAKIPLVKLLGITPSGLNASSDGEIRVFYDHVHAMQTALLFDNIKTMIDIIQLSLFGQIYDGVTFEFKALYQQTPEEKATTQKLKAETGAVLIEGGIISAEEERARIAADPASGYNGLDVGALPDVETETEDA